MFTEKYNNNHPLTMNQFLSDIGYTKKILSRYSEEMYSQVNKIHSVY